MGHDSSLAGVDFLVDSVEHGRPEGGLVPGAFLDIGVSAVYGFEAGRGADGHLVRADADELAMFGVEVEEGV